MKDMDFYTGFTKNLKLRFEQHNNGFIESTRIKDHSNLYIMKLVLIKEMHQNEKNI